MKHTYHDMIIFSDADLDMILSKSVNVLVHQLHDYYLEPLHVTKFYKHSTVLDENELHKMEYQLVI